MNHKFLIHNENDNVGVAVVDIKEGEEAKGVCLEDSKSVVVKSKEDIPLAHKIAFEEIAAGSEVIKYGVVIGKADQYINRGDYVHEHNLKSVRWNHNEQ